MNYKTIGLMTALLLTVLLGLGCEPEGSHPGCDAAWGAYKACHERGGFPNITLDLEEWCEDSWTLGDEFWDCKQDSFDNAADCLVDAPDIGACSAYAE
jgi:hypothetical protein